MSPRRYLMCRPEWFTVVYEINPWMDAQRPVDTSLAVDQWERLREVYLRAGHEVELIDPVPGLPDMVYAANGAFVLDGVALASRFRHGERHAEAALYGGWLQDAGYRVIPPTAEFEGEGDALLAGDTILAGTGFRSSRQSHDDLASVFDREVVGLRLKDPYFYHLDTALAVLDPVVDPGRRPTLAYLPDAFDDASLEILRSRYPDAILVDREEADEFALNLTSDGRRVFVSPRAPRFVAELSGRGYEPVGIDLSELRRGGGGIKCCTLELRPA